MGEINKVLTILIPTYNRKRELIEQLKSIERQGFIDRYYIVISDNCSDYDVNSVIKENFSNDFYSNITIHRRTVNVGGTLNIIMAFQYVKTNWMWLLSDDDETVDDSLKVILKDLDFYTDSCYLKYSIEGFCTHHKKKVDSMNDLFDTYWREHYSSGDLIFMSNGIFQMKYLTKYLSDAIINSMCHMSQIYPVLCSLRNGESSMMILPETIVRTRINNASYSASIANLSFFYTPIALKMDNDELLKFKRVFKMNYGHFPKLLDNYRSRKLRRTMFQMYFAQYYCLWNPVDLLFYISCHLMILLNIKISLLSR